MRKVQIHSTFFWSGRATQADPVEREVEEVTDELLGEMMGEAIVNARGSMVEFHIEEVQFHTAISKEY